MTSSNPVSRPNPMNYDFYYYDIVAASLAFASSSLDVAHATLDEATSRGYMLDDHSNLIPNERETDGSN